MSVKLLKKYVKILRISHRTQILFLQIYKRSIAWLLKSSAQNWEPVIYEHLSDWCRSLFFWQYQHCFSCICLQEANVLCRQSLRRRISLTNFYFSSLQSSAHLYSMPSDWTAPSSVTLLHFPGLTVPMINIYMIYRSSQQQVTSRVLHSFWVKHFVVKLLFWRALILQKLTASVRTLKLGVLIAWKILHTPALL